MNGVKITRESGITYFNYNGIEIDSETWESAACPMCCKDITDDDYCDIVILLYNVLLGAFGQNLLNKYINREDFSEFEDMDTFRWSEEERLFNEHGGIYYEDMTDEEYAEVCGEI